MFSFILTVLVVALFFKALGYTFRIFGKIAGWLLGFVGVSVALSLAFALIGILWKLLPAILVIGLLYTAFGNPRKAAL